MRSCLVMVYTQCHCNFFIPKDLHYFGLLTSGSLQYSPGNQSASDCFLPTLGDCIPDLDSVYIHVSLPLYLEPSAIRNCGPTSFLLLCFDQPESIVFVGDSTEWVGFASDIIRLFNDASI